MTSFLQAREAKALATRLAESDYSIDSLDPQELRKFEEFLRTTAIVAWKPLWLVEEGILGEFVTETNFDCYFDALPTYPSLLEELYFAAAVNGRFKRRGQNDLRAGKSATEKSQIVQIIP